MSKQVFEVSPISSHTNLESSHYQYGSSVSKKPHIALSCLLKPVHTVAEKCDCRRIRRLSPLSRRFLQQSHFSATEWAGLYNSVWYTFSANHRRRTFIVARVTKNGRMASTSKMFMMSRQKLRFDGHEMKRSSSSTMNHVTQTDSTTKNASR